MTETPSNPMFRPGILQAQHGALTNVVLLDIGNTGSWSRWALTLEDSRRLRLMLEDAERKAGA
jgi:hypothetical protein